jgi:hypothetical protein
MRRRFRRLLEEDSGGYEKKIQDAMRRRYTML